MAIMPNLLSLSILLSNRSIFLIRICTDMNVASEEIRKLKRDFF